MRRCSRCVSVLFMVLLCSALCLAAPKEKDVIRAMKQATSFMTETVSTNGGFVWNYSADLSRCWGEVPARKTQIWVQGATNGVGEMFLDVYDVTGDGYYLECAKRTANAIIWGQYPAGGWHYLIDFDMAGIRKWYDEVASRCWGWEEYYHYYGNCTYDDDATASSIRLLMRIYLETLDSAYKKPLLKGLEFVLESQFPNGAWPQRYPLKFDYPKDGRPDYTSYYTFNDGVIPNNIFLLLDAYEKLGDRRYYDAARRGMDFYLICQGPEDQAGWAEQYNWNMQPAQSRTYEPAAYKPSTTIACINALEKFYLITGDRRYLKPITSAIEWIEKSAIDVQPPASDTRYDSNARYTHARYYEPGTNKPLFVHREGASIDDGRYYIDYEPVNLMCHLGMFSRIDTGPIRREYERIKALTPKKARAEYLSGKNAPETIPGLDAEQVEKLIKSLGKRGAWVTDIRIRNYVNPCDFDGEKTIKGISTRTYQNNMQTLMNYLKSRKKKSATDEHG